MPAEDHQDYAILELGSKEDLTGFLRKKLTFDFVDHHQQAETFT
jgi:hypothetical protein